MAYYLTAPSVLRNRLNWQRLYDQFVNHEETVFVPMDVKETEQAYLISAVLPGVQVEDLGIEIEGDLVKIQGEFKTNEEEGERFLMKERSNGKFSRSLRLPVALNAEKSEAKLQDGILTLHILKAEEALPKKIKVNGK